MTIQFFGGRRYGSAMQSNDYVIIYRTKVMSRSFLRLHVTIF